MTTEGNPSTLSFSRGLNFETNNTNKYTCIIMYGMKSKSYQEHSH